MRYRTLAVLFAVGLVSVGVALAGINDNWSVHADGSLEIPETFVGTPAVIA